MSYLLLSLSKPHLETKSMLAFRSIIVILAVIAVVKGQLALPTPVKGPTRIATLQDAITVTSGVSIQHLPGTDSIVVVWIEVGASITTATAQGAILSTNGEVKTTFPVSAPNTVLSLRTPAHIMPHSNGSFTVIYATYAANAFSLRNFDSSGQPLSDPVPVDITNLCIFTNAVFHESSGDIFLVGTLEASTNYLLVQRINSTGGSVDFAVFQTTALNVNPTIAVNGNSVAVSVAVVNAQTSAADLQVFVANIDDLNNATTFNPFEGASTVAHQVLADPLNENSFVVITVAGITSNASLVTGILGTRFNRENSSIAQTFVSYTDLALTSSVSLYQQGGVLILTTATDPSYVLYPIQLKNDTVFDLDTNQFDLLHAVTANETNFDAYKDLRTATTTWSTGSAAVWTEVSAVTGAFSIVTKIYGTYCGDNFAEGAEECDGGASCNADCTCPAGLTADNNNGCAVPPPTAPSGSAPSGTRPISVGPVTTPGAATSEGIITIRATLAALLIVAASALF